jgi:hypothetical protein
MTTRDLEELGDAFTQHVLLRDGAPIPLTLRDLITAIPHGADPAYDLNTRLERLR